MMEIWLSRIVDHLPGFLKSQVEDCLKEGTFISFAEAAGPESSEVSGGGKREKEGDVASASGRRIMLDLLKDEVWRGVKPAEAAEAPEAPEATEAENEGILWITLPQGLNAEALLRASLPKGVAFLPGSRYSAPEGSEAAAVAAETAAGSIIGLRYAGHNEASITAGMARIAEALGEFTARSGPPEA
ncbi:hypothetical protein V3851_13610 [Paenibacillus sp. M1]|uniref:Uncharacterized protein n=1 Tax=Paenibacillus haidiansis TaxID=1574488 RepID=A0ABU7VSW7_9BACL